LFLLLLVDVHCVHVVLRCNAAVAQTMTPRQAAETLMRKEANSQVLRGLRRGGLLNQILYSSARGDAVRQYHGNGTYRGDLGPSSSSSGGGGGGGAYVVGEGGAHSQKQHHGEHNTGKQVPVGDSAISIVKPKNSVFLGAMANRAVSEADVDQKADTKGVTPKRDANLGAKDCQATSEEPTARVGDFGTFDDYVAALVKQK
jgi:hypothetical protein